MVSHGHQDNDAKCGFYLLGQGLNPFRKWFVIPTTFVPLSHQWACRVRSVLIVACRLHRIRMIMVTFSSKSMHSNFQCSAKQPVQSSRPVPVSHLSALLFKYVASPSHSPSVLPLLYQPQHSISVFCFSLVILLPIYIHINI